MTRFFKLLAVVATAGSLLAFGGVGSAMASNTPARVSTPSARASALARDTLHLRFVKAPATRVPPALKAHQVPIGESPDQTSFFQIVNYYNYCLDANDAGSTAGMNGDKVQLWTCTGKNNQYWEYGGESASGNFTLINHQYPSKCLNADDAGGLKDGQKVQLWDCGVDTSNEYWDVADWATCVDSGFDCTLPLEADNYKWVLDAEAQHIGDGDKVQIWTPNGLLNQYWY